MKYPKIITPLPGPRAKQLIDIDNEVVSPSYTRIYPLAVNFANWRDQIIQKAFRKGLLLLGCGENTLRICPALTVSEEEIDVFLTIFEETLREL